MKVFYQNGDCASHLREWAKIRDSIPDFESVYNKREADVIIIYLCAISKSIIDKIDAQLRPLIDIKRSRPNVKIFVGGCAMGLEKIDQILAPYDFIDGTFEKTTMAKNILDALGVEESKEPALYINGSVASITISTGCLRSCGFCKTGYLPSEYHSVPLEQILKEVAEAVEKRKIFHICLTGENTTEYGIDWDGKMHLEMLIRCIFQNYPSIRIMDIMGITLDELSEDLICYMLHEPRIQKLQVEMQSFLQVVRDNMGLRTSETYAKSVYNRLRASKDVMSNIIIGYPGENDGNFSSELAYIATQPDTAWALGAVMLDATPGTRVYAMARCSEEVAEERLARFIKLHNKMRRAWVEKMIDRRKPVKAHVYAYDERYDTTICVMYGQPAEITIPGKYNIYDDITVYLTGYSSVHEPFDIIRFRGSIEDPFANDTDATIGHT